MKMKCKKCSEEGSSWENKGMQRYVNLILLQIYIYFFFGHCMVYR